MADLRKTQPEWTRFLGREVAGMFLASLYELQAMEDRYSHQRTPILVMNDMQGNHLPGGVRLEGVDLGVNTSTSGFIFVRVTGPADPRTVSLYRAPGGVAQTLVARGQGNAGTVLVLAEQNKSGLSGSWELPGNVTEDVTDLLRLFPVPDWPVRLKRVWDGTVEKDVRSQDEFLAAMEAVASRMRDARLIMLEAFTAFAIRLGNRGADFLRTTSTSLVTDSPLRGGSGSVSRRRVGFLADLSRAMKAESVAGEQAVAQREAKASAATFAPGNRGKGKVTAHRPREFCPRPGGRSSARAGRTRTTAGSRSSTAPSRCSVRTASSPSAASGSSSRFQVPTGSAPSCWSASTPRTATPTIRTSSARPR